MSKTKKFLTLKYDHMFKTVVLSDDFTFLNNILSDILEKEVFVEKVKLNELPLEDTEDRVQIVDVLVKTSDNEVINVEVNINFSNLIMERNLMYYFSLLLDNYDKKEDNEETSKIIQINLNFEKVGKVPKEEIRIHNMTLGKVEYDNFKVINVNLLKYKRMWYDKNINGDKEHLYLVMLTSNKNELEELGKKDALAKKVGSKVFELNEDEEKRIQMKLKKDAQYIARKERELAEERGIKKGLKRGIRENQITTVKRMLQRNMDIKEIVEISGLTEQEIQDIQDKMK